MKEKIAAGLATLSLLTVIGLATYSETGKSEHAFVVDLQDHEDPFEVLPQLMPKEQITSIRAIDRNRNEYKMIIKTHEQKHNLLKWILENSKVEHARID